MALRAVSFCNPVCIDSEDERPHPTSKRTEAEAHARRPDEESEIMGSSANVVPRRSYENAEKKNTSEDTLHENVPNQQQQL